MSDEEKRRIAAERKRNYRLRKKNEEMQARIREDQARMQDYRRIAQATPNPLSKEQQEQAIQQILAAHPELEEQFRKAQENSPILPTPRDRAQAILADAEERQRRVQLIMSQYQKDACNTNALLWHLLETFTLMRLELTDLIGSLRK